MRKGQPTESAFLQVQWLSQSQGNFEKPLSNFDFLICLQAVYLSKGPNNTLRLQTTKADGKIGALKSGGPKRTQKLKVSNAQQSRKSLADNVKATRPDLTGVRRTIIQHLQRSYGHG